MMTERKLNRYVQGKAHQLPLPSERARDDFVATAIRMIEDDLNRDRRVRRNYSDPACPVKMMDPDQYMGWVIQNHRGQTIALFNRAVLAAYGKSLSSAIKRGEGYPKPEGVVRAAVLWIRSGFRNRQA